MRTDTYTKSVLTVIALCLLCIVINQFDFLPKAHATSEVNFATVPINEDGTINVRVLSFDPAADMNVNITGCFDCPLDVKVKNQVEVIKVN